jgi:hypothetical protein
MLPDETLADPDAPPLPARVGRFLISSRLGEGAFGVVYRAYHPDLDCEVALKVAKAAGPEAQRRLERFQREAAAVARLRHPHIVPVFDAGRDSEFHWIASAFIDGSTLEAAIAAGDLDYRRSARIVLRLAEALAYAHGQGVVHRDVKPANVLLDRDGQPLLTDFGLAALSDHAARLTQDGAALGTPLYMAPEQAVGSGDEPTPAADQYSLGVLFYELLTGRPPFAGPPELLRFLHQDLPPPPPRRFKPDVPRELEAICLKCLNKNPRQRYASCADLAVALQRFLEDKPAATPRSIIQQWLTNRVRRVPWRRVATAVAAAVAFLLFAIRPARQQDARSDWQVVFAATPGGKPNFSNGRALATDAAGNVYAGGQFEGTAVFNPASREGVPGLGLLTSNVPGAFLAKYDADGGFLWAKRVGDGASGMVMYIVADAKGFVYVVGEFGYTAIFHIGGRVRELKSPDAGNGFVAKYDADGNCLWAEQVGGKGGACCAALAVTDNGTVYVSGKVFGLATVHAGNEVQIGVPNHETAYVAKLNEVGEWQWVRSFQGDANADSRSHALALDREGKVYVTGGFTGTVDFGRGVTEHQLKAPDMGDVFVSKMDGNGACLWVRQMRGTGQGLGGEGNAIAFDGEGAVYVAGCIGRVTVVGWGDNAVLLQSEGDLDMFIAKMSDAGDLRWAHRFGGPGQDTVQGVAVDPAGGVFVTGHFQGTATFDETACGPALTASGPMDAFLFKFNAEGRVVLARRFGGDKETDGVRVALNRKGGVWLCVDIHGTVTFDEPGKRFILSRPDAKKTIANPMAMFFCHLTNTAPRR